MSAWFAGDFERCLQLCDAVRARDAQTRVHVALLRARALLRLHHFDDALSALSVVPATAHDSDEAVTARMLTGEAYVRRGDPAIGLKILLDLLGSAQAAHRTIRSEIWLNVGLAHYGLGDFVAADAALRRVEHRTDMVYARAVQYRGWVATACGEPARGKRLFMEALTALDRCEHYDRYFDANCTRALAHLAVETFDRHTWGFVAMRRSRIDWSSPGQMQPRFFIAYCASAYQLEVEGNVLEAAREARLSEELAPSSAFRVQARCRRAAVAGNAGEAVSHRDHVESAGELFARLDPKALAGDEKMVPLVLAEQLAAIQPDDAHDLIELHRSLSPMPAVHLFAQSSAALGYRTLVEAIALEASGDVTGAASLYKNCIDVFKRAGYIRRAVFAALRLWPITRDAGLLEFAKSATRELPARSAIRREVERVTAQRIRLTAVQREVIALICQGKSNPEIARLRKRSLHTVRNLVARLFELFEVQSREQLAVECVRRGLYTPS